MKDYTIRISEHERQIMLKALTRMKSREPRDDKFNALIDMLSDLVAK